MTNHDSADTTRKSELSSDETRENAIALGLAVMPPSTVERRLAVVAGTAWIALVATFFLFETFLSFALPAAMLLGALAGALYPRSPLRGSLSVVLGGLLLCFVESRGTIDYLVMAFVVCVPVLAPALWIGAWASAVGTRYWRTRHLFS